MARGGHQTSSSRLFSQLPLLLLLFNIIPVTSSTTSTTSTCPSFCQCNLNTKSVICRSSGLTTIPHNLPPDTVSLHLGGNVIAMLDWDNLSPYPELRSLDLSDNLLSNIGNTTFTATTKLQRLILRNNRLRRLNIIWPTELVTLDISGNKIRQFTLPNHVKTANLSGNVFTDTTQMFSMGSQVNDLDLSFSNLSWIKADAFLNVSTVLHTLKLNNLPYLYHINHTAFKSASALKHLQIRGNPKFGFIHKDLFKDLVNLVSLDVSRNNITSFYSITYKHLNNLQTLSIHSNPLICNCALQWLLNTRIRLLHENQTICHKPDHLQSRALMQTSSDQLQCTPPRIVNYTQEAYFRIGSQAVLKCLVEGDPEPMVRWTIPNGRTFIANNYLEEQWDKRASREYILEQIYHRNQELQKDANKYKNDFGADRILLLSNGDLFITYVQRIDAGPYKCQVVSPGGNETETMQFLLNYTIIKDITVASMIVGFSSAGIFFGFGLLVALVRYIGRKCRERKRKKSRSIKKIIENLDTYRTHQMDRLRDNYGGHVGKMKEHALAQMDKMRENYFSQIARIQEKCATRMDHLRDNYNTQMGKIKGYSTHQIEKMRDNYSGQMIKIRDYSSGQLERLRETYKLQHQHLMKILEGMNIDNCRGLMDDETNVNSVLFETKFSLDNLPELNLDNMDLDTLDNLNLDTLDNLNLDNLSGSRNSCISDDFETANSDPDELSVSELQAVEARVHKPILTKPQFHCEATQTLEEDLAGETDAFVIDMEDTLSSNGISTRI